MMFSFILSESIMEKPVLPFSPASGGSKITTISYPRVKLSDGMEWIAFKNDPGRWYAKPVKEACEWPENENFTS